MKLDVSELSYHQIERLVRAFPLGVDRITTRGARVTLDVVAGL